MSEVAEAGRTEQDKVRKELCRRISGLPESCWGKTEEIPLPVKILDMGVDVFQAWHSTCMQSEVESCCVGRVYWKVAVAHHDQCGTSSLHLHPRWCPFCVLPLTWHARVCASVGFIRGR
jgi:hypothetical protein